MAQGVRIEQGTERREVQGQEQAPRGPRIEQATVPLSPVMAPRPSSFAKVGAAQQMMDEALKWGSKFLEEQVGRENRKSLLEGQSLYMQGKTLEEMKSSGASNYTMHGWQLMDVQTTAAMWNSAMDQKITESDHQMDPDTFRQNITGMLSKATEGKDQDSVDMIMATSMKYLPGLMETHLKKHYEWRENQTFSAAVSHVAATAVNVTDTSGEDQGKKDWLSLHNPNPVSAGDGVQLKSPMAQLSPRRYNEAMTAGIQKAYEEDNPLAHTWAKEAGYLANLNGTQLAQVRSSEAEYYRRKENKFDAAVIAKEFDITEGLKTNKYDILTGIGMMRELYDQKGLKLEQADLRRVSSAAAAGAAEQRSNAEAELRRKRSEADAAAREEKREADNRADALAYGQYQISKVPIALAFQNKEITPEQYMDKLTKLGDGLKLKIGRGLTGEAGNAAMDAAMENLKNQARLEVIDHALSTGDVVQLHGMQGGEKLVQEALRTKETRITQQVMDKVASGKMPKDIAAEAVKTEWLDFWDRTGVVDKKAADSITAFARTSGLATDGTATPQATKAFAAFVDMYNKNPTLALKHVTGSEEQARLLSMYKFYNGTGGYSEAIREGALALGRPEDADAVKKAREAETFGWKPLTSGLIGYRNEIDKQVDGFMSSRKSGWFGNLFSKHDLQSKTGYLYSTGWLRKEEADTIQQRYVPALKEQIATKAADNIATGRTKDYGVAAEMAAQDILGRTVVMGNTMITAPVGKHPLDLMFGPGGSSTYQKPDVPSDALRLAVQQLGQNKWPKEYDKHTPGAVMLHPVNATDESVRGPTLEVVQDTLGEGVWVRFQKIDNSMSSRAHFSYAEMGLLYKATFVERNKKKPAESETRLELPVPPKDTGKLVLDIPKP